MPFHCKRGTVTNFRTSVHVWILLYKKFHYSKGGILRIYG